MRIASAEESLAIALRASVILTVGIISVFLYLLVPAVAQVAIAACIAISGAVLVLRYPVGALTGMLLIAPFYDLARVFLLPNISLLGAWQDVIVLLLAVAGVKNLVQGGRTLALSYLDIAVIVFGAAYLVSIVLSPSIAIWFYVFRWCTLYPFLYLVLKTYRFTEKQVRHLYLATLFGLSASVVFGYVLLLVLGPRQYSAAWDLMNLSAFWREGNFRWPASFPSPITASLGFALLFLAAFAGMLQRRRFVEVILAVLGVCACVMTFTRSGWLVSGVGFVMLLWATAKRGRKNRVVIGLTILGVLAVSTVVIVKPEVAEIISTRDQMDAHRITTFELVLTDALRYPFGVGVGTAGGVSNLAAEFVGDHRSVESVVGDSFLLQVLRDTGWVGFCALLIACVGIIAKSLSAFRAGGSSITRTFALTTFAFSGGMLLDLMNAADVWPTRFYFWLFAAITVAMLEGRVECEESLSRRIAPVNA